VVAVVVVGIKHVNPRILISRLKSNNSKKDPEFRDKIKKMLCEK